MSKLQALFVYRDAEQERAAIDAQLRSTPARQQFNRLYKTLKDQQAAVGKLASDQDVHAAQAKKFAERAEQLSKQLELETSELETMLQDEETTSEEMTELRGDIERLNKELSQVVKEAKALFEAVEAAIAEYRTTVQEYNKNRKTFETVRATCEQEKAEAAQKLAQMDEKIAELAKAVDPQLLAKYKRSAQHNQNALVPVRDRKCSGCFMLQPMAVLSRLTQPDATVECENCGRILYVEGIENA